MALKVDFRNNYEASGDFNRFHFTRSGNSIDGSGVSVNVIFDLQYETIKFDGHEYYLSGFKDFVGGSGADTIIGDNQNNVFSGSSGNDNLQGNEGNDFLDGGTGADKLSGGSGNDTLVGGVGNDTLIGGTGNDDYYIEPVGDTLIELEGQGYDVVFVRGSYTLGDGLAVEELRIDIQGGTNSARLTGNQYAQTIRGSSLADTLQGMGGEDMLYAEGGDDVLEGGTGTDMLDGGDGDDTLDGGEGFDIMSGGNGDDIYYVDHESDQIAEGYTGGRDTVIARASYALDKNAFIELIQADERLGSASISLTGNGYDQTLKGGGGGDTLKGEGGNDLLYGLGGNDSLDGGDGSDMLDGGVGQDAMAGGLGDDTYYVDSSGDQVVERQGEGYDMIVAKGDYALAEGVSIELLRADDMYGKVSVQLRGNAFAQTIATGNGNDTLDGRGGGDTLSGGAGDDRYTVYSTADSIVEYDREGFDVVAVQGTDYALAAGSEVERIEIASSGKSRVVGNELSQTIVGNGFDNIIDGGGGNDILYGSAKGATLWSNIVKVFSPGDSDTFLFSTALGANNVDRIHNFEAGIGSFSTKVLWWTIDFPGTVIDRIGLSKSIFDTIGVGTLSDKAFCDMGKEKVSAADRILYDRNSGSIYYDADGSGAQAAIKFAEVDAGLAMKASNFFVYA